jgi:hypothetical protein
VTSLTIFDLDFDDIVVNHFANLTLPCRDMSRMKDLSHSVLCGRLSLQSRMGQGSTQLTFLLKESLG